MPRPTSLPSEERPSTRSGRPYRCSGCCDCSSSTSTPSIPPLSPPGLIVDDAPDDENTLSMLLQTAGWPVHRVRRISELHWHRAMLSGPRLEGLHLAPVPWVLQFGQGSTRASDVAQGVAHAIRSGQWDDHLAAITRAMTEPPYPRVLVLRVRRRATVVEDGNHFVVASLLQYPDPDKRPPVTSLLGQRPRGAPVLSVGQQTEVARRTIEP